MNTFGERLKHIRKARGLTQTQLAKMAGMTQAAISEAESKARGSSRAGVIAKCLAVNPIWLTDGKGPMYEEPTTPSTFGAASADEEYVIVPHLDLSLVRNTASYDSLLNLSIKNPGPPFPRSILDECGVSPTIARVIYAQDESNAPTITTGSMVLINMLENEPQDSKIFLIRDPDGVVFLKRLIREYREGDMAWIMRNDNPNKREFPDRILPEHHPDTRILGRAVWNANRL